MIAKVAFQKIRRIAKRGSNEMLERAIREVYLAGMEAGARALSEQLKGRINDLQSTGDGPDLERERRESHSPEPRQS
jgi:pyrimidine operon attenuation protein/uracil phosphoribosyltransferase